MESTHPATHQQHHQALFSLAEQLSQFMGLIAEQRDTELHLTRWQGTRKSTETVTCAPRPDDGNRLWIYDSKRRPVAQPGHPDTPLLVARLLEGDG